MVKLSTLMILIVMFLVSCENSKTDKRKQNKKNNNKSKTEENYKAEKFVVDDFPISNTMLSEGRNNDSSLKKVSGNTYSYDKVWFSNDSLNQTIIYELYTDYHRMIIYHFYSHKIPADLIYKIDLHVSGGNLASEKQKLIDFNGFLNQSKKIRQSYFVSNKGFKLGDLKHKAITIYGKPDKTSIKEGIEQLKWIFVGDEFYNGKSDLKGKPLAKDSYGHDVIMYFKDGELIGQILFNDIP